MVRAVVTGMGGRMGRALLSAMREAPELEVTLAAGVEREGSPLVGQDAGELDGRGALGAPIFDSLERALDASGAQVVIDFTSPTSTVAAARLCAARRVPFVTGTTGLSEEERRSLAECARAIPLLAAPNMSVAVALFAELVERAARALTPMGFDAQLVEMHHRHKKDAPSGTALALAERAGVPREAIHALRGGDVFGDHSLILAGLGERLELSHKLSSRAPLAQGALRAARFVAEVGAGMGAGMWEGAQRPAGLYTIRDVVAALDGAAAAVRG